MKLRDANLSAQELDDETIVLDLAGAVYLRLNGTGTTLWRRLTEGASRDDLVTALTSRYDVDRERAETDVDAFISDLQSRDLLDQDG